MNAQIKSVLSFWFGDNHTERSAKQIADDKAAMWFSKNDEVDRQITERFAALTKAAVAGELTEWENSARGMLALIICTDQFPRNMYRNTPDAFASDANALAFAKQCIASEKIAQLTLMERVFIGLPLEHSEQLAEQQYSVDFYQTLTNQSPPDVKELFNNYLHYARRHQEIIQRFGRFPHRNEILGRVSTGEELAFLLEPDSSF